MNKPTSPTFKMPAGYDSVEQYKELCLLNLKLCQEKPQRYAKLIPMYEKELAACDRELGRKSENN